MARLRYMLNDVRGKVDINASWIEEFYNGPVRVINGYAETNDDIAISGLLRRGFELVEEDEETDTSKKEESAPSEEDERTPMEKLKDEAINLGHDPEVVNTLRKKSDIQDLIEKGV